MDRTLCITILLLTIFAVQGQWLQPNGNAQNTGTLMSVIGVSTIVNNQSIRMGYSFNTLLMNSRGIFYATSGDDIFAYNDSGSVIWSWRFNEERPSYSPTFSLSKDEKTIYFVALLDPNPPVRSMSGAIDATTGKLIWSLNNTGTGGRRGYESIVIGPVTGNLYIASDEKDCLLTTISPDGEILWKHSALKPKDAYCSCYGPAIDANEERIVMEFHLYGRDILTLVALHSNGSDVWSLEINDIGELDNPISIYQNYAYLSSNSYGSIHVVDLVNAKVVRYVPERFFPRSPLSLAQVNGKDYLVCVGVTDGERYFLRIYNPDGTNASWVSLQFPSGWTPISMPVITGDGFAVMSIPRADYNCTLCVVDLATGLIHWTIPKAYTFIRRDSHPFVGLDGRIYADDHEGILKVFEVSKFTKAPTPAPPTDYPTSSPTPQPLPDWFIPTVSAFGSAIGIIIILLLVILWILWSGGSSNSEFDQHDEQKVLVNWADSKY